MPKIGTLRYLRRAEASRYLADVWNVSRTPATLAKLACTGGGPPFQLSGRFPLYTEQGLDDWAQSLLGPVVNSTSEVAALKANTGEAEAVA